MVKTKELSVDLRQRIINLHKSGNSYSSISNQLTISRSTVHSVIIKRKGFNSLVRLRICLGVKIKPNCHRQLHENSVDINPRVVFFFKEIAKRFNTMAISVNIHTMQSYLNRNGLYENQPRRNMKHCCSV